MQALVDWTAAWTPWMRMMMLTMTAWVAALTWESPIVQVMGPISSAVSLLRGVR